jgi:hypothetical protein
MKSLTTTILAFCFALMFVTTSASAQMNENVKQRIMDFKVMKLIEILNLSGEASDKFMARYRDSQLKVDEAKRQLDLASGDLQNLIKFKGKPDELTQKTDAAIRAQQNYFSTLIERVNSLKPLLNQEQFAKLVAFEIKFPELLQKFMMNRAKAGGGKRDILLQDE